jgi:hypothetical protein
MEDYYKKIEYVSNSMLNYLKISPKYFQAQINKEINLDSASLELGRMIHLALLEPDKFVLAQYDKPTGLMGAFCELYIKHRSLETAYELSGFKQSFDVVKKNFEKEAVNYVNEVIENQDKIFLSRDIKYKVDKSVESVLADKYASKFLLTESPSYNEIEVYWEKDGIKKKAKLDKLIIDGNKAINVDIKTTRNNVFELPLLIDNSLPIDKRYELRGFSKSYYYYGYYRQQAFYEEAIEEYAKQNQLQIDSIEHIIIAVQTSGVFDTCVYKFQRDWIELGKNEIKDLLSEYKYYQESGLWDKPLIYNQIVDM